MKKITGRSSSRRSGVSFVAVGCCAGVALSLSLLPRPALSRPLAPIAPVESGIYWENSIDEAISQGRAAHKTVMVDFYTDWCGWCKKLDSDTYTDPAVANLASSSFITVKLNAEKEGLAAAKTYGVHAYPTILFLNPQTGTEQRRLEGYLPPDRFQNVMRSVLGLAPVGVQPARVAATQRAPVAIRPAPAAAGVDEARRTAATVADLAQRASASLAAGDANSALATLAAAEKLDPANSQGALTGIYSEMGRIFYKSNRYDTAIVFFQRVANTGKTDTERSSGRLQIAICRTLLKDYSAARSASLSVKNDPDAPMPLRLKAQKLIGLIGSMEKH